MTHILAGRLRERVKQYSNVLIAASLAFSGVMPIILSQQAGAAQLTQRSVTVSTSQPSAAGVTYSFSFTTATASAIQSMVFQFCTTALSTCILPGTDGTPSASETIDVSHVTAAPGAFTGTNATAFTEYTGVDAGACNQADGGSGVATMYCVTRTEALSEASGVKTFSITGIRNPIIPTGNNEEIYIRITTFSDTAFATPVDDGTVAASIVNQLNVTGRIQERLVFCVFALDDTAGSSGTIGSAAGNMPTDCAASEANASTNVDMGVIDNLSIQYAPEDNAPPTNLGNDRFGAALVNTNASNGVALTYYATAATSGTNELRAFRVPGATCNVSGTSLVDQCFISADEAAGETLVAGTERFGVQIACVVNSTTTANGIGTTSNLGKDGTGSYVQGSGTNGSFNSVYDAGRANIDDDATDDCENNPGAILNNDFAWNDTSTAQALISSVTVIDDEMVKFRFGATAQATTPTGTYTVASTYIATPTF